jgi:hypothetical protein
MLAARTQSQIMTGAEIDLLLLDVQVVVSPLYLY